MGRYTKRLGMKLISALWICASLLPVSLSVAAEKSPATIKFISDSVTTSGYVQAMAIGTSLSRLTNLTFDITPVASSLKRMQMLRDQKADYCICSMDSYFAQEGLLQFATPSTGPHPLRIILSSSSEFRYNLAIAKDTQAKTLAGLKGKRVPWIRNADQLNANTTAFLAYAGLEWGDVQKMTFPGYNEAVDGFIKKQIDAIVVSTSSPRLNQIITGRRKIFFPNLSSQNKEGWARIHGTAPYLSPVTSFNKTHNTDGLSHPYPILLTTVKKSDEEVYVLTKAISENLDAIQSLAPGAEGWNLSWQNLTWIMPYHDGAIRYFQEVGLWSDAAQRHQNSLLKRQTDLISAFKRFKSSNPNEDNFIPGWRYIRDLALTD